MTKKVTEIKKENKSVMKLKYEHCEFDIESHFDTGSILGSRAWLDSHPSTHISFDPPSLRGTSFAYYIDTSNTYEPMYANPMMPSKNVYQQMVDKMDPSNTTIKDDTLIIP